MLSALAINGVVLHETSRRAVKSVTGLIGISSVRRNVRIRPTADGSIDDSRYNDESIITIAGDVYGSTQEESYSEFRLITAALKATMTTAATLTWTEGASGLQLQRTVKLASAIEPTLEGGNVVLPYGLVLASSDPVSYSQTLTTATGTSLSATGGGRTYPMIYPWHYVDAGAGTVNFTNAGDTATRPLLRLYGGLTNPSIVLGSKRISLLGSVGYGEYLEIDLAQRTIVRTSSGISLDARNMLDPVNTQWFSLAAGLSTLQVVASTFDAGARLDVIGRSAYV